jgi:hypothetical protein
LENAINDKWRLEGEYEGPTGAIWRTIPIRMGMLNVVTQGLVGGTSNYGHGNSGGGIIMGTTLIPASGSVRDYSMALLYRGVILSGDEAIVVDLID